MLSLKDAAVKYKLSHSHLRLMCRNGIVKAKKIGRDWFLIGNDKAIEDALNKRPERGKYIREKKVNKKAK